MQFYLAPLEGVTGFVVRNAFHHNFDRIDKYFTPFIPAAKRMQKKIKRDILPENNEGILLIPQIMSNKASEVIDLGNQLSVYGYTELNVNLGCPSGTVVSKKRGSGLLYYPDELEAFLDELFNKAQIPISIKTRIGFNEPEEWERILSIYAKYPISELIIHPRTQKDFYRAPVRLDTFAAAVDHFHTNSVSTPLCYNGDIVDAKSYHKIIERFPSVDRVMIGRGLLAKPGLIYELTGEGYPADYRSRLRAFHDEIYRTYTEIICGEKDTLFHMKEIWGYMADSFIDCDKQIKKIKKCQSPQEYQALVTQLFSEYSIVGISEN